MNIYKNFLSKKDFKKIKSTMMGPYFPWYYNKFIVSEEGVKSYIVRKILQLFNGKLQHYLRRMDANCCCIFNEYFEDEIINEKNKSCSYHNFSGAEKKNIDLACLFAFMG